MLDKNKCVSVTKDEINDPSSVIWPALHDYRENSIPEGEERYDDQWAEIVAAMELLENKKAKGAVLLIDQRQIPSSYNCVSLFVNGVHVADSDDHNERPIDEMSKALCEALNMPLKTYVMDELCLAKQVAKTTNMLDELMEEVKSGSVVLDEWCQGYSNSDLIAAYASIR